MKHQPQSFVGLHTGSCRRRIPIPPKARRELELVPACKPGVAGVAGWSERGWEALHVAAEHPEVERLVLLATPIREGIDVPQIAAKTLLLFGTDDERTRSKAARWWKKRIPDARDVPRPRT